MAAEDYVVADRPNAGLTAGEKVAETIQETPDAESRARADAAGVKDPGHINYAAALNTFQQRDDIETLADRRKREYGSDFNAGAHMRRKAGDTAPTSGSVNGTAPASS